MLIRVWTESRKSEERINKEKTVIELSIITIIYVYYFLVVIFKNYSPFFIANPCLRPANEI